MAVIDLLAELDAAGVRLVLDGERIGVRGDPAITTQWLPRLKPHRDELWAELAGRSANVRRYWRISVPGRDPFGACCVQCCTRDELLARYPAGTEAVPL